MKIARYELKVVHKKELILTMEDDVDSEELQTILKTINNNQLNDKEAEEIYEKINFMLEMHEAEHLDN